MLISPEPLQRFAAGLLQAAGANSRAASITAAHLVAANLAGHDSHGAMRLLQYLADFQRGLLIRGAQPQVLSDWPTGAVIDARGVLGQVTAHDGMQLAIDKARSAGMAAVALRHANHSGRLGTYVEQAATAGMVGVAMANGGGGGQWVAPFGGRERRFSTNPIAIGAPSDGAFVHVLDMSTSIAPEGKVRDCLQRGVETPPDWLVDEQGEPTTNPHDLYADPGGALLPFGGPAGHKGSGLAFMVDVFAGALSGAGCPSSPREHVNNGTGVFLMAIDAARFAPATELKQEIDAMAAFVRSSSPSAGFDEILTPGEREHRQRCSREESGIEIPDDVAEELGRCARQLGVSTNEVPFP